MIYRKDNFFLFKNENRDKPKKYIFFYMLHLVLRKKTFLSVKVTDKKDIDTKTRNFFYYIQSRKSLNVVVFPVQDLKLVSK